MRLLLFWSHNINTKINNMPHSDLKMLAFSLVYVVLNFLILIPIPNVLRVSDLKEKGYRPFKMVKVVGHSA